MMTAPQTTRHARRRLGCPCAGFPMAARLAGNCTDRTSLLKKFSPPGIALPTGSEGETLHCPRRIRAFYALPALAWLRGARQGVLIRAVLIFRELTPSQFNPGNIGF